MNSHELLDASDKGDIGKVKSLLQSGFNVNSQVDEWKIAPLHAAASNGHKEIVEILIANGANINIVNKFNCTPIYFAAALGYTEIVKLLLEKGANTNIKEVQKGETPVDAAKRNGHMEIVNLLSQAKRVTKCYIATQVYGNPYHPSVFILREYRDNTLSKYYLGRMFVHMYYIISPHLTDIIIGNHWIEKNTKKLLDKIVDKLSQKNN
jgi:hypothetical protein